ncbi:MAG: hypothetical protein ACLQVX_23050 [Limisphaerales bacterium]
MKFSPNRLPQQPHLFAVLALSLIAGGPGTNAGAEPRAQDAAQAPATPTFAPARKTSFEEVTRQLDPGGSVFVYVATDQWLGGLSTNLLRLRDMMAGLEAMPAAGREQADRVFKLLFEAIRTSGIEAMSGVGVSSVQVTDELHRSKLVLDHNPGQDEGLLWNLFGAQAHPLRGMDMLPATTALAAFGDLDAMRAWNAIQRAVSASGDSGLADGMVQWQQKFEQGAKLSWTNLLASFGGEAGIILTLDESRKITLPIGPQPVELPEPGLIIAVKVNNDALFERVSQELKANPQTEVKDEPGLKMCVMPLPLPLPMPVRLTVATSGGWFFAATAPELVRAVLDAPGGKTPGVSQSARFKALRQYLPAQGNQFFYADKRLSETLLQVQKQAIQSNPAAAGLAAFFNELLSAKGASFGLVVGGHTPTGWEVVSVGNRDTSGALLMGPVAGGIAVPAAMLLPALARAKTRAQSIACVNNLKQIGLACRMWAADNGDQFPFNVSTNKGGTLEFSARGDGGFDRNAFRHLRVLSSYLASNPKLLVCPGDTTHQPAADFLSLQAANVTYEVRSGTNVNETQPQEVLARCPIHGHELLCDGSVKQGHLQ